MTPLAKCNLGFPVNVDAPLDVMTPLPTCERIRVESVIVEPVNRLPLQRYMKL